MNVVYLHLPSLVNFYKYYIQGPRSRGEGGAGKHVPPEYFKIYKELVRKSVLCPPPNIETLTMPPPPPPPISKLRRGPCYSSCKFLIELHGEADTLLKQFRFSRSTQILSLQEDVILSNQSHKTYLIKGGFLRAV